MDKKGLSRQADFSISPSALRQSPGDDRALLLPRQYNRHVGKPLQVLVNREEGGIWLEGENLGVTDDVLTLQTKNGDQLLPLGGVLKARIKLPW